MTSLASQESAPARVEQARFTDGVTRWAATAETGRAALPWRRTTDPWAILLSESMLAQTQVSRVAERFPLLLARFPSPLECASAPVGEVLRAWSGLGYNRRPLALHRAAVAIVERHHGVVPRTFDDLHALPGVGEYTARAVMAFAFDLPVAVVDVNIRRSLHRAVAGRFLSPPATQALADHLAAGRGSRSWNLALMDFGSLVCRARNPICGDCPVAQHCAWRASSVTADPGAPRTRQAKFEGSDRQGRGRLLKAACDGPIRTSDLGAVTGWPDDRERIERVVRGLIDEGLLVDDADGYRVP